MKKKSTSQLVRHSLGEGGSAPARRSLGEGGFFNLRVLIGLFIGLAGVLLALIGFGAFSNASAQANVGSTKMPAQTQQPLGQQIGQMTVIPAVHSDLSPPLREQPVEWPQAREERETPVNPGIPFRYKGGPDPVIQSSFSQTLITPPAIPAPIHTWAGISKPCDGCGGFPPDTNGAVGKTQYVEMVNVALQVFDKLTGTSLLGPIPIDSLWFGFRDACRTGARGDPVVVYDKLADRWVISQFATPVEVEVMDECIAVSQTGDATGAWYRYDFHVTRFFVDYPKFGVWPDGYYMSANIFIHGDFAGPQAFVFDRAKMLVGDPTAKVQTSELIHDRDFFLPSDLDGILPPRAGDPNHFVQVTVEENGPPDEQALAGPLATPTPTATPAPLYKVWAFHVDWDHPANSRFSPEASLPAAGFTRLRARVPQKGTEEKLDSIGDRLMFRNAYRRFPDGSESMVNNITVSADSVAGIRWFELQRALPGNWAIRQQRTYHPNDNTWRWMGSIASDNQGNIALGFSASSPTIYPQIRYAGRLATDPLNTLSGEQHLFNGTGSQETNRWGDYSDMTIDPVDDCTFYYTNEYYATTTDPPVFDWQTRIGYFRFSQCTSPQQGTARFTVCDRGAPLSKALVSIDGRTYGATLGDGKYEAVLPPGSHTYAVSNPAFATQRGSFTITNGQTTLVDLCPNPRSTLGNISARAFVQTGDNVMIGGFMVQGTERKRVIIRAIGPELGAPPYNVPNALADPTLELHDATGALIASNNTWLHTIIGGIITSNQVGEIEASGHAPGDPRESAIIADLLAGNYTAIVRGVNNTTGVALVEVYGLSPETDSILANISARSFVQTGDNVMIGGFMVQGTVPERVIIRAIGPELGAPPYNVPNALANPTLELHDGTGALIASNNNWVSTIIGGIITSNQVPEIQASGYAPGNPFESAIIATLQPGNYTAIVSGVNNTTGVALVEVYNLQ